jgi:hypothetical protein
MQQQQQSQQQQQQQQQLGAGRGMGSLPAPAAGGQMPMSLPYHMQPPGRPYFVRPGMMMSAAGVPMMMSPPGQGPTAMQGLGFPARPAGQSMPAGAMMMMGQQQQTPRGAYGPGGMGFPLMGGQQPNPFMTPQGMTAPAAGFAAQQPPRWMGMAQPGMAAMQPRPTASGMQMPMQMQMGLNMQAQAQAGMMYRGFVPPPTGMPLQQPQSGVPLPSGSMTGPPAAAASTQTGHAGSGAGAANPPGVVPITAPTAPVAASSSAPQ